MQFIASTKSLIFLCILFSLAASKTMKIVIQKINKGRNEKEITVTADTLIGKNQKGNTGLFRIQGANGEQKHAGEYQIQRIAMSDKKRVRITTFNTTSKQKKVKFYVNYSLAEGDKFLTWLSKCGACAHIACEYEFKQRNSLVMYMEKSTKYCFMTMILNFGDDKRTGIRALKDLTVTMPKDDPTKYYGGWDPKDGTRITAIDRPSIRNDSRASFRVTVTTKNDKVYYRTIYATWGKDLEFDNVKTFLNLVYDYQTTSGDKIFTHTWSPLMQRAFGVEMTAPEVDSAPAVMQPSTRKSRRKIVTRLYQSAEK